jgi:hypothetical protein
MFIVAEPIDFLSLDAMRDALWVVARFQAH